MIGRARRASMAALVAAVLALGCGGGAASPEPSVPVDPARAALVRFWELFNEATRQRLAGNFDGAAGRYTEALALQPAHEDSLYYLGQCRREVGRHEEARDAFARLVEVNPASVRGHSSLGAIRSSPDAPDVMDLAAAERHLRRALELNREETGPMLRLGEVLILRGDLDGARHWLEAAARTNDRSVEAAFLTAYLMWEAGETDAAHEYYRQSIRAARPETPTAGVLGEGDRKQGPLRSGHGDTVFGRFSHGITASEGDTIGDAEIDALFGGVREFARSLTDRDPSAKL